MDGVNKNHALTLKIIKDNETYYKIGITNNTVERRFRDDSDKKIISLKETWYLSGALAQKEELELLRQFKEDRQNIKGFLKSGGNSELFEYDILGLDK